MGEVISIAGGLARGDGFELGASGGGATATLASMEGALILCGAERSVAPLNTVADELMRLVTPEPASRPRRRKP